VPGRRSALVWGRAFSVVRNYSALGQSLNRHARFGQGLAGLSSRDRSQLPAGAAEAKNVSLCSSTFHDIKTEMFMPSEDSFTVTEVDRPEVGSVRPRIFQDESEKRYIEVRECAWSKCPSDGLHEDPPEPGTEASAYRTGCGHVHACKVEDLEGFRCCGFCGRNPPLR